MFLEMFLSFLASIVGNEAKIGKSNVVSKHHINQGVNNSKLNNLNQIELTKRKDWENN